MNWDAVIWMILSILGAALIAGGIVAHRRSQQTGVRAFGAAALLLPPESSCGPSL